MKCFVDVIGYFIAKSLKALILHQWNLSSTSVYEIQVGIFHNMI